MQMLSCHVLNLGIFLSYLRDSVIVLVLESEVAVRELSIGKQAGSSGESN